MVAKGLLLISSVRGRKRAGIMMQFFAKQP